MATTRCKCGETLHYSAEKVGLVARCRCGRKVPLPKIKLAPAPKDNGASKAIDETEKMYRSASIRLQLQIFALLVAGVVVLVAMVWLVTNLNKDITPGRERSVQPTEAEPQ
jgi:hypothetical protein